MNVEVVVTNKKGEAPFQNILVLSAKRKHLGQKRYTGEFLTKKGYVICNVSILLAEDLKKR